MLTTPMVARFHSSAASSSATETLKLVRSRSFKLRTTWRLSLIDCAASMWSSRVRKAIIRRSQGLGCRSQKNQPLVPDPQPLLLHHGFCRDPFCGKRFDYIARFDVAVV